MSLCCTVDDGTESSHERGLSPSPLLVPTTQLVSVVGMAASEETMRNFFEPMKGSHQLQLDTNDIIL